jgi:type II secretory pathway pseudopilin PulG
MEAHRASKAGFSMVELLIAMGMTAVVGIGAYSLTIKSTRRLHEAGQRNAFTLSVQQAQTLVRADLDRALYIAADVTSDHLECASLTDLNCNSVIVSTITPRFNMGVDGSRTGFQSIRFVIPKASSTYRLADDMTSPTDDVELSAADAAKFQRGGFAYIYDGDKADVFYITKLGNKKLSHAGNCSGGSTWNHCNGLSKAYTGIVSIRPVDVITLGLRQVDTTTYLIRKVEGDGSSETQLSSSVNAMEVGYFGSGIDPSDPNEVRDPPLDHWPWIFRTKITLKQKVPQTTEPVPDSAASPNPDRTLVGEINLTLRQYK